MFIFQKLPFYAKYGAIPESYLIALSYEEQLLWLCKHIEDLDEKIDSSFLQLQTYINEGLASKQDTLTAGENITIEDNVISADLGEDITSSMLDGYEYQNFNEGEILPENPVSVMSGKCINLGNNNLGNKVKLHGKYLYYEVDSDTYEILVRESGFTNEEDEYQTIEITTNGNILISFDDTQTHPCSLIYYYNYMKAIRNLELTKQDKLIAGENITIVDNVISATGGSGGVSVTKLTQDLVLYFNTTLTLESGFYDTDEYNIRAGRSGNSLLVFEPHQVVYYDSTNEIFIGDTKTLSRNLDTTQWEITLDRTFVNTLNTNDYQVPTCYAVSQAIESNKTQPVMNYYAYSSADYTSGYYYDLTGVEVGDLLPSATADVNSKYLAVPYSDFMMSNNKVRITGYSSQGIFLLLDKDPTDPTCKITYIGSAGGYSNELFNLDNILVDKAYVIFNFTDTDDYAVAVERPVIVNVATNNVYNPLSPQSLLPSAIVTNTLYNMIQNIDTGITNETTGTTSSVTKIWSGTQTEYNNLAGYDSTTLYFIKE